MAITDIEIGLNSVVSNLSDENYDQSLAFYRVWADVGYIYSRIPSENISNTIWNNRGSSAVDPKAGNLFHPTAHLILRFASDVESNCMVGLHSAGLQSRLCAKTLRSFFEFNASSVKYKDEGCWHYSCLEGSGSLVATDSNLIAQWANSGCVEEVAIRDHILQSLISYPKLYDHQADALIILFKIAGATFEAYADPSVVDRCFGLLKNHYAPGSTKNNLVQVCIPHGKMWLSS